MADFQESARQAKGILSKLGGLDMADRDSIRQDAVNRLTAIESSVGSWASVSPSDSEAVENIRDQIADHRQSLHDCVPQLELLRTEWADRYRQQIGDGKNEFEKLSDQMQQKQSAEAYRWKNNFSQVTELMEAINRFNGQLMDASSQIEQENADTMPPAPDPGPLDRTDRDPDMPANLS